MQVFNVIRMHIGWKILLSYILILSVSLISFLFVIHSFRKANDVKVDFVTYSLPYLVTSQSLAQSILEQAVALEALINTKEITIFKQDARTKIKLNRAKITAIMKDMRQFCNDKSYCKIEEFERVIQSISKNVDHLKENLFKEKPSATEAIAQEKRSILQNIGAMKKLLRKYAVNALDENEIITEIITSLVYIEALITSYNDKYNKQDIQQLNFNYSQHIREIPLHIFSLKDKGVRKKIAENLSNLILQTNDFEKSFFKKAQKVYSLSESSFDLIGEIKRDKAKLNRLIAGLVHNAQHSKKNTLNIFQKAVQSSFHIILISMICAFLVTGAIILFYIQPLIVNRIRILSEKTRLISSGHYDTEIDVTGYDELSDMSKALEEFKQALIAKEKLLLELTRSNEELERFAYICSHDLQEPLRMIRAYSGKLEQAMNENKKDSSEKVKRYLKYVTSGAVRGQELITDILQYSSIDKDGRSFEDVDTKTIVTKIEEQVHLQEENSVEIIYHDLPLVRGHKTQLMQLFQNIIGNGIKYKKPNITPRIEISVRDKDPYWQFAIKDNGIGMEKRYLSKIFDVFQRLHGKGDYPGTGIGLAICKKVVEKHKGKIWVDSTKGEGTVFFFTLMKA